MLTGGSGGEDKDGTVVLVDGSGGEDKDGTGVEAIGAGITPGGNVGGTMVALVTEDGGGCAVNIPADCVPVTGGARIATDKGGGS